MKKYLLIILFFVNVCLSAQAPQKFFTKFGGYGHDIGYGVIQTLNGQYAVTGSTSSFGNGNTDVYLALIDSFGWVRWERSYGGFNNDIGRSIIQLADSGFVIAGYTNSFGAGGYDMFVVRTDKLGNLIWQKSYGGLDWDFGNCVKASTAGDSLIICGNTYSFGYGKSDAYVVKTDLNGNFKWQKTFGGPEDDYFKSFILTYNNMYAFTGTTKSYGDLKGDGWLFKTGLIGDSIKSFKYGNTYQQYLNDIKEHPTTKNLYMCGAYDQIGKDTMSAWLIGVNENGGFLFQDYFSYFKILDEQYYSLAYSQKTGDYIYTRRNFKSNTDLRIAPMISDFLNQFYVTANKYGSSEDDELYSIANTKDKGFVCVGYTKGFNALLTDVFLLKLDSNSIFGATSAVGMNEPQKHFNNFSVYPTVTKDEITIDSDPSIKEIIIYVSDCLGHVLLKTKSKEIYTTLSLGNFNEGFYFITVSEGNFSKTFKVIKSN